MTVSRQALDRLSGETGFRPDTLEKVIRLGELAADIGRQPTLSAALALKGGTALNLCFGAPRRLSFAEAAAGKLVAALARGLPRDVYDVRRLPSLDPPGWSDQHRLRRLFVAVAGVLDRPLTEYGEGRIRISDQQVRDQLEPMLARDERPTAEQLRSGAWQAMAPMLDLDEAEREYTTRLQLGELLPELLFPEDAQLAERLARHPALLWKAQNAREHTKGRGSR